MDADQTPEIAPLPEAETPAPIAEGDPMEKLVCDSCQ
jgi:hypothetical protein